MYWKILTGLFAIVAAACGWDAHDQRQKRKRDQWASSDRIAALEARLAQREQEFDQVKERYGSLHARTVELAAEIARLKRAIVVERAAAF
jgi:uncharacterized protein involved in exopolysaccharide biosynthesis